MQYSFKTKPKARKALLQKHYFVQFGAGKNNKICHQCKTIKRLKNRVTTYQLFNNNIVTECPPCNL